MKKYMILLSVRKDKPAIVDGETWTCKTGCTDEPGFEFQEVTELLVDVETTEGKSYHQK